MWGGGGEGDSVCVLVCVWGGCVCLEGDSVCGGERKYVKRVRQRGRKWQ